MNSVLGFLLLLIENIIFPVAALGYLAAFILSPRRALLKKLSAELAERFVLYGRARGTGFENAIWIHAASVGEARSVAGLVEHLWAQYPGRKVIITSSTAAGKAAAQSSLKADLCLLAPLDFYPLCARFIATFKPACLFVVETELWPGMFVCAGNAGLKICVINGRLSAKSSRSYKLLKPLFKLMAKKTSFVFAQSAKDAERYRQIGFPESKVITTGNVKYDLLDPLPVKTPLAREIITKLGWQNEKLLVCGSVHPAEEELFIPLLKTLRAKIPGLKIAIAQRHLERQAALISLLQREGVYFAMLSDRLKNNSPSGADCLVLDAMGWLTAFYAAGTAAFVGGTIAPRGGHNLLEPAITGKPVFFGPHTGNTPDVAAALLASGGGILIDSASAATKIHDLLTNADALENAAQQAAATAATFRGATEKLTAALEQLLDANQKP